MASLRNLIFLLATVLISGVLGWDIGNENDRQSCQSRTRNPLEGCEAGKTVFVDGVGNGTRFRTVQSGGFSISGKQTRLLTRG